MKDGVSPVVSMPPSSTNTVQASGFARHQVFAFSMAARSVFIFSIYGSFRVFWRRLSHWRIAALSALQASSASISLSLNIATAPQVTGSSSAGRGVSSVRLSGTGSRFSLMTVAGGAFLQAAADNVRHRSSSARVTIDRGLHGFTSALPFCITLLLTDFHLCQ